MPAVGRLWPSNDDDEDGDGDNDVGDGEGGQGHPGGVDHLSNDDEDRDGQQIIMAKRLW